MSSPAFSPSKKIVAVSETVIAPASDGEHASGVIAKQLARRVQRRPFVQSS